MGVLPIMAPPERGTFFRLQLYERVGILLVVVYERVEIKICHFSLWNAQKAEQMNFMDYKVTFLL